MFRKLWSGDVSLPVTYWVFGVLIGGVVLKGVLLVLIELSFARIAMSEFGNLGLRGYYWFTVAYSLFMAVAIWRSAQKYQGIRIWSHLARAAVVLGVLSLAVSVLNGFAQGGNSDTVIDAEFRMMNKSLPVMIDEGTRLDNVSRQQKEIHYHYTLIGYLVRDLNIDRFNALMTPQLKTVACTNVATRPLLDRGRRLVYFYNDKEGHPIVRIVVSKSDCT